MVLIGLGPRIERRLRPRVVRSFSGRLTTEFGEPDRIADTGRVAVIAHYSDSEVVSRSLHEYVTQLNFAGYRCVVCSTSPIEGTLKWMAPLPPGTVVLRRRNVGYDFGSWSAVLHRFPAIRGLDDVILTNDSLIGPFAPMIPLLDAYRRSGVSVWSLTDSFEISHHLQSYFLGFQGGVLASDTLRRFFGSVRVERTVWDVVTTYEIGLTARLRDSGLTHAAHFRSDPHDPATPNPTIVYWETLLDRGFPFVKRTLVKGQDESMIAKGPVSQSLRDRFAVELVDWL